MTREIKFRAWDKNCNKMMYFDLFNGAGDWLNKKSYPKTAPESIMQFTGLLDKNGKEIYFGDIIEYADMNDDTDGYSIVEVIETMNYGVGILDDHCVFDLWEDSDVHQFTVIGNIYENPELLK